MPLTLRSRKRDTKGLGLPFVVDSCGSGQHPQGSNLERALAGATVGVAGRALAVVRFLELLAVLRHEITPDRLLCGGKSLANGCL